VKTIEHLKCLETDKFIWFALALLTLAV